MEKLLLELSQEAPAERAYRYDIASRIKSLLAILQLIAGAQGYRPPQTYDYYALEAWPLVLHVAGDCETVFVVIGSSGYSERTRIHVEELIRPRNLAGAWAIHTHEATWRLYRTYGYEKWGGPPHIELPSLREQMRWIGGQYGLWDLNQQTT